MIKIYPDISHHHKVSDWDKIKKNCPFIITKATQGTSFVDDYMREVIKQCEKRNIPYWLYTYLNKGDELAQARFMVSTCKRLVGKNFVGYILDVEVGNKSGNVKDALKYIEGLGHKCMIYTMFADYANYRTVIAGRGKNTAWWEARYGLNDGVYRSKYPAHDGADLHQFTDKGTCPGITDKIDLNRITGRKSESWFKTPLSKEKKGYTGTFPVLPNRGYYQIGDGYKTLTMYPTQIKRVQKLLNWAMNGNLVVDGKYGEKTADLQKKLQKKYDLPVNGKFGDKSLKVCKNMKK